PAYTKRRYVDALRSVLGEVTLQEACDRTGVDLLITAKDAAAGEETFFAAFVLEGTLRDGDAREGASSAMYSGVLLRAALEATMSAPTYFQPLERFVDGGVTAYNNPSLAAIQEAVAYHPAGQTGHGYDRERLTVLSLGTGCRPRFVELEDIADPNGLGALFWLDWLLSEAGDDASDMQSDLLRSELSRGLDYRRFQVSLDAEALTKLPDLPLPRSMRRRSGVDRLSDLTDRRLGRIRLDRVEDFGVMKTIGLALVRAIQTEATRRGLPPFGFDPVDERGRELFVTRRGEVERIRRQMSSPAWLDDPQRKL
ncbi:MAG: hypothetical protein ACYTGQ_12915, partial [Planctomycetota bacterium]